jgi:hypothetical protein
LSGVGARGTVLVVLPCFKPALKARSRCAGLVQVEPARCSVVFPIVLTVATATRGWGLGVVCAGFKDLLPMCL